MNAIQKVDFYTAEKLSSFIQPIVNEEYFIDILIGILKQEEQVEIPVKHFMINGMYGREIFMPKGTFAIGALHPTDFLEVISDGSVLMLGDSEHKVISAPMTKIGMPNVRKCGYVLEDTTWTTFHKVNAKTIEDAEKETIDYSNLYAVDSNCDFKDLLQELNMTDDDIKEDMKKHEVIEVNSNNKIRIQESNIEGLGIFINDILEQNERIGVALSDGKKTTIGRYTNHSHKPNASIVKEDNGDVYFIARRKMMKNEEITIDYREALLIHKENTCPQ